jgi:hypothetical protein
LFGEHGAPLVADALVPLTANKEWNSLKRLFRS